MSGSLKLVKLITMPANVRRVWNKNLGIKLLNTWMCRHVLKVQTIPYLPQELEMTCGRKSLPYVLINFEESLIFSFRSENAWNISAEAVVLRCSVKKGVLRNFTKLTRKHPCQSFFFNKVALTQAFSCEFCGISKNTFLYRTPLVAASVSVKSHQKDFFSFKL